MKKNYLVLALLFAIICLPQKAVQLDQKDVFLAKSIFTFFRVAPTIRFLLGSKKKKIEIEPDYNLLNNWKNTDRYVKNIRIFEKKIKQMNIHTLCALNQKIEDITRSDDFKSEFQKNLFWEHAKYYTGIIVSFVSNGVLSFLTKTVIDFFTRKNPSPVFTTESLKISAVGGLIKTWRPSSKTYLLDFFRLKNIFLNETLNPQVKTKKEFFKNTGVKAITHWATNVFAYKITTGIKDNLKPTIKKLQIRKNQLQLHHLKKQTDKELKSYRKKSLFKNISATNNCPHPLNMQIKELLIGKTPENIRTPQLSNNFIQTQSNTHRNIETFSEPIHRNLHGLISTPHTLRSQTQLLCPKNQRQRLVDW